MIKFIFNHRDLFPLAVARPANLELERPLIRAQAEVNLMGILPSAKVGTQLSIPEKLSQLIIHFVVY